MGGDYNKWSLHHEKHPKRTWFKKTTLSYAEVAFKGCIQNHYALVRE